MAWRLTLPYFTPHRRIAYSGDLKDVDPKPYWAEPLQAGDLPPKSPACPLSKHGMSRANGSVLNYFFPCMGWERCPTCMSERSGTQLGWFEWLFSQNFVVVPQVGACPINTEFLKPIWFCEFPMSKGFMDVLAGRRRDRGGGNYRWVLRAHPDCEKGMLSIFADRDFHSSQGGDRWAPLPYREAVQAARYALRIPGVLRVDGTRKWAPKTAKTNAKYWAIQAARVDLEAGGREFCREVQKEFGAAHALQGALPEEALTKRPVSWYRDMLQQTIDGNRKEREGLMDVPDYRRTKPVEEAAPIRGGVAGGGVAAHASGEPDLFSQVPL